MAHGSRHLHEEIERLRQDNRRLEDEVAELRRLNDKRAEQLRALAVELLHAEQLERRRIAAHLHDNLQQLLVVARMRLMELRQRLGQEAHRDLTSSCRDLERALQASRELATQLSPPVLQEAGLAAALEWLAGDFEQRHGLAVGVALEAAEPASEAIRVFLYRAVNELLFNVVKHAEVDRATVTMCKVEDFVRIDIEDQGRGMQVEQRDRRDSRDGGMGLWRIGRRIDILGGSMTVDSKPGQGTRIHLRAPLAAPEGAVLEHGVRLRDGTKLVVDREHATTLYEADAPERLRILIADDHQMFREGLVHLLADVEAIEVVGQAANGRLAIELTRSLQPEVVVMDARMPMVDGIEATREILAHDPKVRVLILSVRDDDELRRQAREAGAVGFLSKEEHPTRLVDKIRKVMGVHTT